jgi:hypothetical protein
MADTKQQLMNIVKEWIKLDNDMRTLQKELAKRRVEKKEVSTKLSDVMRTNEIEGFDLNDGKLSYTRKSVKKPLTKKVLTDVLSKYFKGDTTKATEMNEFIMENREEIIRENIVRKINK